jgi:hypothetical protein
MYVQGYLQGSENGRVVTIGDQRDNPNNPVVILRFAILTHPAIVPDRGRSIIRFTSGSVI